MVNIPKQRSLAIVSIVCLFCISVRAQQSFSRDQFTSDFNYMWSTLRGNYAYFDKKETDWNKVRELYRPMLADVKSRSDFVTLLERVLDELYDNHTSLNTNLKTSSRLVPSGLDLWAEWRQGRAVITQLRRGFSAEQAGLKIGMEIISINGLPVEEAVARRLPKSLRAINVDARNWALRAVLAGTHDQHQESSRPGTGMEEWRFINWIYPHRLLWTITATHQKSNGRCCPVRLAISKSTI